MYIYEIHPRKGRWSKLLAQDAERPVAQFLVVVDERSCLSKGEHFPVLAIMSRLLV
jgi:hypothetical protein